MKKIFVICFALLGVMNIHAQYSDRSPLLIVGSDTTTRGEFMRIYLKNNEMQADKPPRASVEDYLNLYINFRMKVLQAREEQYDTNTELRNELAVYRKSVAEPYITDMAVADAILKEAYNFSTRDLRASQILIGVKPDALPADTLAAYKKAMEARAKLIAGEPTHEVALKYSDEAKRYLSNKRYRITGREGDYGYFTAFQNVYPFEKAVFNLPMGKWSMPIRTIYGYHVVKVTEEHPALGKIRAAHILVAFSAIDTSDVRVEAKKKKAEEIYSLLQNGEKFEDMVHLYSDDKASASKNGYLGEFGVNRMLPQIIEVLYNTKVGEYTKPIQTALGFHIVKLISTTGQETFENLKPNLEFRIQRDLDRAEIPIISFVEKMKKENGFSLDKKTLSAFNLMVKDSIRLRPEWASSPVLPRGNKTLFTYNKTAVSESEFAEYVEKNLPRKKYSIDYSLNQLINEFEVVYIRMYEMNRIDQYDYEFKALMDEYRDGVYLFDITNRNVWERSSNDTVGLEAYFNSNRDSYKTPPSIKAMLFTYDVKNVKTPELAKLLKKLVDKKMTFEAMKKEISKKYGDAVKCEHDVYPMGTNKFIDNANRTRNRYGLTPDILSGGTEKAFAVIEEDYPPKRKELNEIRGLVVADYQNYLEKVWIESLHKKYPVTIVKPVFDSIFK
ncbi:MAG: peptidylprolyl isomerase [Bacteroidales bacterium]|jgi:peptidyl-prolyl cis-trans isomerase SurA|nr:peptidylprolyl isomerase [Bacteroidales bacterium]